MFGVYDVEAAVSPSKQLIGPFIGQGEMEVELWVGLYSSNSNKNMPVFSINSQTGQIKTSGRGSLDFEMISLYTIEVTAFDDGEKFYGGTMNKTINGFTCQNWMSSEPRDQPYAAAIQKGDKTWENVLGNHNFCRNPSRRRTRPWCYTIDGPVWEYCRRSLSQRKTTSLNVIIMVEDKNDPPIPSYDSSIYFVSENTFPGTTISTLSSDRS